MLQDYDISDMFRLEKVSEGTFRIVSDATFFDNSPLELMLLEEAGGTLLTDNKSTIKYMNKLYELGANDVKKCISLIIKAYSFKMRGGEIICDVSSPSKLSASILNMIQCCTQMANMFIFFDKPE